jgi:peptidoglycan/LPS O-acetylase OafA/YrhL
MIPLRPSYQAHIDGLRGLAVMAVICFHAFPGLAPGGFVGVDIFFVISGYLISGILFAEFGNSAGRGGRVIRNFYSRRVRRIFPALLLVLGAVYGLGFRLLLPSEFTKLTRDIIASAGFCLNLVLAGRLDYFDAAATSSPLLHLWSLGLEEQFYLLWPLVIWGVIRFRARILPVAVFLGACSFCWNSERSSGVAAAAFYLPQMRLWELLLGSVAARLGSSDASESESAWGSGAVLRSGWRWFCHGLVPSNCMAFLGFMAVTTAVLFGRTDPGPPNGWTTLATLGAVALISSSGSAWINRRILGQRILVWIGLISYPLYLWHWPLLSFARISAGSPPSPLSRALILVFSILLGWLTYVCLETPIRRSPRSWRVIAALAGGMAALVMLCAYTVRVEGFKTRFPPLINAISSFRYDPVAAVRQGAYFLIGDQDETQFRKDPNEILPGRPTLYLWGDSHAAALYPGVSTVYGRAYNIVQRTTASTPPFMPDRFNPGNARQINQFVFQSIVRDRPEFVLLDANWQGYDWRQIEGTITALQAAGIHHIVLIGPVPQWNGSLPQQLFNYMRGHRNQPVPERMSVGVDPMPARLDPLMAALAQRLGVDYVSPCRILGNGDGFLVRTGDTADSLMTYDSSHLTANGSKYLVSHFPKL